MLARSLYRFRRFDLSQVPAGQRQAAIALQLRQWLPFPRYGSYIVWQGGVAAVWAWDSAVVEPALSAAGLRPDRTDVIPETLLRPAGADGSRLQACEEGVEGLVWRSGSLVASRWWPRTPAPLEWSNFVRDSGDAVAGHASSVPEVLSVQLLDRPWAQAAKESGVAAGFWVESVVMPAAVLGLLAASVWFASQWGKARAALLDKRAQLARLEAQVAPLASARAQALELSERARAVRALLDRHPDVAGLLVAAEAAAPKDGTQFRVWELSSGRLSLHLSTNGKTPAGEVIKKFEGAGPFQDVQATPGPDSSVLVLAMGVKPSPLQTPKAEVAAAAGRPGKR